MEYTVRGFASLSEFTNVTTGIYPVGEIDDYCRTFSTQEETFVLGNSNPYYDVTAQTKETSFIKFTCRDEQDVETSLSTTKHSFFTTSVSALIRYVNDFTNADSGLNQLNTLLANTDGRVDSNFAQAFSNVQTGGNDVVTSNPSRNIPPSISFTFTSANDVYNVKLWFSNSDFRTEYDYYEIRIAGPVKDGLLKDLNGNYATVKNMIENYSYTERMLDNAIVRGDDPETEMKPITMEWVDLNNPAATLDTAWTIIGYGPKATEPTNIVKALKKFLTDKTTIPLETWIEIFPYLQSKNEFLFFPLWDQKAVHAVGAAVSAYNPIVNYSKVSQVVHAVFPADYQGQLTYTEMGAVVYKSLGFVVLGHKDNMKGNKILSKTYPDFANIMINSPNLNYLDAKTQLLLRKLEAMLSLAEVNDALANPNITDITNEDYNNLKVVQGTIDTTIIRVVKKEEVERLFPV